MASAATQPAAATAVARDVLGGNSQRNAELVDVSRWTRDSPPWLTSLLLHMLAVLTLGLLWVSGDDEGPIVLDAQYAESIGEQLIDEPLDLDIEPQLEIEESVLSLSDLPQVDEPIAAPELTIIAPTPLFSAPSSTSKQIGVALSGRTEGMKQQLLAEYGGTATTERAVLDGLRWLVRNQRKDGWWSLKGPYQDGANTENRQAATAMALLAFQGAGYTTHASAREEFSDAVRDGWKKLLSSQDNNGSFYQQGAFNHGIYTQAQCSIALCELYAMTGDKKYREPAQKAIDYLVKIQSDSGGWRYSPTVGSDLSVTGWVVMALKSAQMAGLDVPSQTLYKVREYLDELAHDEGARYAYQPRDMPTLSMCAEGLLCRQYLGWSREDERLQRGVYYLLDHLPDWERGNRNVYYWYYGTQVCHHMEGDAWERWNNVTRQLVPEHQVKQGKERGSWDVDIDERHGRSGGRLYTTCLSIYILEVYYRHLPLYKQGLLSSF